MARLYVPLDVNYQDDPRVLRAGPMAELVYLRSLTLAKRLDDDGRIEDVHLRRLCDGIEDDPLEVANDLCNAGLWITDGDAYRIAAWLKHNPSKAALEADREAEAERGRQRRASARTPETVQPDAEARPAHEVKRSESEENTLGHEFESWWADYPQHKDKAQAFKAFKARRRSGVSLEDLCQARDNYVAAEVFTDTQYLKRGGTFLNGAEGPWSEYLAGVPDVPVPKPKPNEPVPVGPAYVEWIPGSA
jgi:hypothetical protein